MPSYSLTVTEPFAGYVRGDEITDPQIVAEILDSEAVGHVVKRPAQAEEAAV